MKFHPVPNDDENGLTHCLHSENDHVRIGVWRVMYGFRVRAGYLHDLGGCTLDWCAGGNWKDVERLYSLCAAILSQRDESEDVFKGIPRISAIKPFYSDTEFVSLVSKLAGDNWELINLEKPIVGAYTF